MTAPKGDTASFPGFSTSDDYAAVQPAQDVYPLYAAGPAQSGSRQASGGSPTNWGVAPMSGSRLPPSAAGGAFPQPYVGGQLENYMTNVEHGDSQRQTEEMRSLVPLPPPVPGPPAEEYKGGNLQIYSSEFAHGDHKRETEERGELPYRPYFGAARGAGPVGTVAVAAAPVAPAGPSTIFYPPGPTGLDPRTYYLFITGQLPPGTYSHASATHEAGGNHYGEAHYERFGPQPRVTETQDVSSDMAMQQSGGGRKGY